ncbi:MAG TPA: hypothetical protein VKS79_15735, partial [Gemmataceae bacterium]|nr:hypothetical protein [Gemmataceae bacterium]
MIRRISVLLVIGAVIIVGGVACEQRTATAVDAKNGREPAASAPAEIGPALYPAGQWPSYVVSTTTVDPIVMPGHISVMDKVDLPSQRDGKIMVIGRELRTGEQV